MKIVFPVFFFLLFLVGCAPFQNLSVDDVRTKGHVGQSGEIEMPLEQILLCNEKTIYNCGEGARITLNPDCPTQGTLFFYSMGLTQLNPYVIIDFNQIDKLTTMYKSYVAMQTWKGFVTEAVSRINACGDCSRIK